MNKKKLLKNIQKEQKNNKNQDFTDNYFKFITTLAILLILFMLSYFVMGFFYTKEISFDKKDEDKTEVTVDNDTIMIGQLFDQSNDEYYVLIYNKDDETSSISSWLKIYNSSDDATKIYYVDSDKKFNSSYIVKKDSNKNANSLSELRVIDPTLVKINNKNIVEYIEGEENIVNILKGEK